MSNKDPHRPVAMPTMIMPEDICLNNQTVGNLRKFLESFPDDAKVVISGIGESFASYDCQIACNFEFQRDQKLVQFIVGMPVEI